MTHNFKTTVASRESVCVAHPTCSGQNHSGSVHPGIWESGLTERHLPCASVNAIIVGKELDSHYFLLEVTFCSHCIDQVKSHGHGAPPRVELSREILLCAEKQRPRNMWDINTVYHTEAQRC